MGMKIWPAEKLQRMLTTMYNTDTGEEPPNYSTRHGVATAQSRLGRQADLQKLLQNEKLNGPLDRDHSVATQDMIQLRGFYIYIHDMDEITRPVMVREYPKVAKKDEGKWPQFRLSGNGKCPFIEDPHHMRKQQQQEQEEQRAKKAAAAAPRTRAAAAMEEKRVLGENNNIARRTSVTSQASKEEDTKPLDPPKIIPTKRTNTTDSMPPMFGSAQASIRTMPRFAGGQPVASGIQQSNITSAIRSQMISSTSAAPGARAGNSKEVNQLKRKVLEKNSAPSANSGHSSVMNDMRAALNQESAQPARAAKRKAQETLGYIREDTYPEEEERQARKIAVARRRKTAEKELKPGYCENCREKFNDFDEVCSMLFLTSISKANCYIALLIPKAPQVRNNHRQLDRARYAAGAARPSMNEVRHVYVPPFTALTRRIHHIRHNIPFPICSLRSALWRMERDHLANTRYTAFPWPAAFSEAHILFLPGHGLVVCFLGGIVSVYLDLYNA